jgi:glucokinase
LGGTNVRFAVARQRADGTIALENRAGYKNDDYESFDDALNMWLADVAERPKLATLALSFAGPISNNAGVLTNRTSWRVDGHMLASRLGLEDVALFNDFAAAARGVVDATEKEFEPIKDGESHPEAPIVVGGPGTGFGMAAALPWGGRWRVLPGEGGHRTYAPETDDEWAVARALKERLGHVSTEVVAAGKYAEEVRKALYDAMDLKPFEPLSADEVRRRASQEHDAGCLAYCRLRAAATMAALGDAVLVTGGKGGVVLFGGEAERLVDYMREDAAIRRFVDHGPMSRYLKDVPVRLAKKGPDSALRGVAQLYLERE